jgi:hypothetical protein
LVKMKKAHAIARVSPSAIDDEWQRRATAAAIGAARGLVCDGRHIPSGTPVGRLGDTEWGWVFCAMLFAWIATRAEQAAAEQLDAEQTIRMTGLDPQPWDIGAVMAILPELADACPDIEWSQPLASWPREIMADFLLTAMRLIRKAMIARDLSGKGITRKSKTNDAASPL